MREFAPSEQFFRARRRRALFESLPLALFPVVLAAGSSGIRRPGVLIGLLLLGVLVLVAIRYALPSERDRWRRFRIVVNPDAVQAMRLPNSHDIVIPAGEIASISERRGRGLVVRGTKKHQVIEVPEDLEGYSEARELLARWRQPQVVSSDRLQAASSWLASAVAVALLWGAFLSTSRIVVLTGASLMSLALFSAAWFVLRNPYAPRTQRVAFCLFFVVWSGVLVYLVTRVW